MHLGAQDVLCLVCPASRQKGGLGKKLKSGKTRSEAQWLWVQIPSCSLALFTNKVDFEVSSGSCSIFQFFYIREVKTSMCLLAAYNTSIFH